ncbi:MAG: MoaD/ThiS family protein [Candidatus Bathyarchaeia archaeon]
MKVKIRIFRGPLSEIVKQSEIIVQTENHAKIIDVLNLLADEYGKQFRDYVFNPRTDEVNSHVLLSLNGVNVSSLKGIETEIEDGSELLILSATGGG